MDEITALLHRMFMILVACCSFYAESSFYAVVFMSVWGKINKEIYKLTRAVQ